MSKFCSTARSKLAIFAVLALASQSGLAANSEAAKSHHPTSLEQPPFIQEAYAMAARGKYDESIKLFERSMQSIKLDSKAMHIYGRALALRNRYKDATNAYKNALAMTPNNVELINDLGVALAASADNLEAKRLFIQATEMSPLFVTAYNNLGVALMRLGDYVGAIQVLNYALRLQPANHDIRKRLNTALLRAVQQVDNGDLTSFESADYASELARSNQLEDQYFIHLDDALRNRRAPESQNVANNPLATPNQQSPNQEADAGREIVVVQTDSYLSAASNLDDNESQNSPDYEDDPI
jgi:Flp pilus assembly protein TadD